MNCPQCGNELPNNAVFCGSCGASLPKKKEKKPFPVKIVLCVLLAVSLLLNLFFLIRPLFGKQKIVFEGKGFDTPEEAITAYAEAFREGDVDKMISTFAIESYVENYDLQAYIERYNVYSINNELVFPSDNSCKEQLNCYSRVNQLARGILLGYCTMLEMDVTSPRIFNRDEYEEEIDNFLKKLEDPNFSRKLSRIEIGDILTRDDFDCGENYEENFKKSHAHLEFDDFCELTIEMEMNGDDYYLFMLVGKIDGKWYNLSMCSSLGAFAGASPLSGGFAKQ